MKNAMFIMPLIAGALWGSVGIFVRKLTAFGMDSYTILSTRVLLAAFMMLVGMAAFSRKSLRIKLKDLPLFAGSGIIAMLGLNYCYTLSINMLSISLAAVLLSLSPIFVMLISAILFKEKITKKKVLCTFIALCGCFLVSGIVEGGGLKWSIAGILIGLLSAVFYALYSIFSKLCMERGYNVFTITFYSMLLMALVLIPFTDWGTALRFAEEAPVPNTIFMILHSLCSNVLPYIIYTWSLKYVDTGKAAILTAGGEPAAAMIFGIVFFGEIPGIIGFSGLIITIIGISILCSPDRRHEPNS